MTLFLFAVLLLGAVCTLLWFYRFRQRLAMPLWAMPFFAIAFTFCGLLSVRLFASLENWRFANYDGLSLYGAIFILPAFIALGGRLWHRDMKAVFDVSTLCMITTLLLARFNCLHEGCCMGLALPWAPHLHWPTREVEMVFQAIMIIVLYRRLCRNHAPGTAFPLYMICYGIFRFIEEWFRVNYSAMQFIHVSHLWSILCVLIGISIFTTMTKKPSQRAKKTKRKGD